MNLKYHCPGHQCDITDPRPQPGPQARAMTAQSKLRGQKGLEARAALPFVHLPVRQSRASWQ